MIIRTLTVVNEADHKVFFDLSPRDLTGLAYTMQIRVAPGDDAETARATLACVVTGSVVTATGDCSNLSRGIKYVYELQEQGQALFIGPCRVIQKVVH